MNDEDQQLVDRIYAQALSLLPGDRDRYLDENCRDERIRCEVLALIDAAMTTPEQFDERFDAIREKLWADVLNEGESQEENLAGQEVGHWRIGKLLARGGLATVYIAHRADGEFDQTVAFKVLRRGLDTDDVVARFRAERQILSALDHPRIAKIFDGGALPDGRPYLVLEYIDGESITSYCDSHQIDVRGCVRLVMNVLQALHHAHKYLVVHRDIKPTNIMVSSEGNVALLDFGIAKLLDPDSLPGSSTLTRTGVSLLTPGYGSPEQLAGEPVTTASDIYQVGAVLYELLSGKRISVGRDDSASGAPSRHLRGTKRFAKVRGDLDAIVQKAMHADPARRYGSASEMVADLERYLEGRPVIAQPDTLGYRLRKLMKRRPWLLPGTAILVLGIAAYIVTLTLYSRQLQLEQQRAEAAQEFMVDLISSPDPFAPADPERGLNITVVEALNLGARRIENELVDQPELKATLLESVAHVYESLDQSTDVIDIGERALALNLDMYGESAESSLGIMRLLGGGYDDIGDYDRARDYFARQLDIASKTYAPDDARLGVAEVSSGTFELFQGNHELGVEQLMNGIDKLRFAPEAYAETFITAIVTATQQEGMNDPQESLRLLEEALPVAESVYGPGSLHTANVLIAIGRAWIERKEYAKAKENYAVGLSIYDALLGPNHVDTVVHYNNFGVLLIGAGDFAGAEETHRELINRLIELRGENHRLVADNYQNLAVAIARQDRLDEALLLHQKAYDTYAASNWDHYRTVYPLLSIAYIELKRGNSQAAESAAAQALNTFRIAVPGSYLEGVALCLTGLAREQKGDTAEGAEMVDASHALIQQVDLGESPYPKLCRVPGEGQDA